MIKIIQMSFNDLTEHEAKSQPDNGAGAEYARYIKVIHNGNVTALESDAMEPEDAVFGRDLCWIPELLQKCYQLGYKDGKHDVKEIK